MTQTELERELAATTGEPLSVIRRRGFSLVEVAPEPLTLDWDVVQQVDPLRYPLRRRPSRRSAAKSSSA